jgi:hypothetical protein
LHTQLVIRVILTKAKFFQELVVEVVVSLAFLVLASMLL